jgi:hypothetical protein
MLGTQVTKAAGSRRPFSLLEPATSPFMLRCKRLIAAMQTNTLCLASGIHKFTPDHEAEPFPPFRKGDTNVQDCIHRPRTLQCPVRPADGLHRPPADRERPHRHSQRRPSALRPLSALRRGASCAFRFDYLRFPPRLKGPGFPGPLFFGIRHRYAKAECSATNPPVRHSGSTIHLRDWNIAYQNTLSVPG